MKCLLTEARGARLVALVPSPLFVLLSAEAAGLGEERWRPPPGPRLAASTSTTNTRAARGLRRRGGARIFDVYIPELYAKSFMYTCTDGGVMGRQEYMDNPARSTSGKSGED